MKLPNVQTLTEEQKSLKHMIDNTDHAIDKMASVRRKLALQCRHVLRPLTPEEIADQWMSVEAECLVCKTPFGWRCQDSPDGVCHYFSHDGLVKMIDGTMVPVPPDHNGKCETDDQCMWCGMPEERK